MCYAALITTHPLESYVLSFILNVRYMHAHVYYFKQMKTNRCISFSWKFVVSSLAFNIYVNFYFCQTTTTVFIIIHLTLFSRNNLLKEHSFVKICLECIMHNAGNVLQ